MAKQQQRIILVNDSRLMRDMLKKVIKKSPGLEIVTELSDLADDTLIKALKYGGGKGTIGAAKNLLRHAVAALLNASHPHVNYAMTFTQIIDVVNAALASLDRGTIEELKNQLDMYNNAGSSIDAHGNPINGG